MASRDMVIKVCCIDWDTDGEPVDLPEILFLTLKDVDEDEDDMDDLIASRLSDKYGFCVNSFEWNEVM